MSTIFSKFQIAIFYLVITGIFIFFLFFNTFKLTEIFKSVYLQENQSVEKFNTISMSFISMLEKNYNSLLPKKELDLPEIRIYLKENEFESWFENLPLSKNQWIKSYVLSNTKEKLLKTKIKIRGDNPNNWIHPKKSFRIQFRKKDLSNFNRTLDYVLPRDTSLVNTYMGYYIARMMGILTPDVRFVNLYINDKLQGLYLEVERTKENFLRKRNLMPVNIYSGSPSRTNTPLSSHNDLFISANLWDKQSIFNRLKDDNKDDINNFLSLLIKSINSKENFNKLIEISTIDQWARYSAYETIMQSWHSYENNNMRVVFDNWKGEIIPIAYDSILNDARNELIIEQDIIYDNAPHLLFDTFYKSSEFNLKKYKIIKDFVDEDNFKKINDEIDRIYNKIRASWHADSNHYQFVVTNNFDSNLFFNKNMDKEVLKLKNRINFIEQSLQKLIYTSNQLEWTYQNNNINLITSSIVPISKINICFNKKLKSKEFFLNDLNVMVFKHNKFNNLNCYSKEITLVSDRVLRKMNLSKPTHFIASEGYEIINTSFNVVPSDNTKPDYIYYKTINSNDYVLSKYSNKHIKKYYRSNIHNNPIISEKDYFKKYLIFEGKNFVNHDLILDNPVLVKPGTNFILDENVSIIFKDKVLMLGKKNNKISFTGKNKQTQWGTISIEGKDSKLKHINLSGGFGDIYENKFYTSMLSVRNTENIMLENINFYQNNHLNFPNYYDDLLHVIYSDKVKIISSSFFNSTGDAVDIDVSDVVIRDCYFENSGNDSIDFMSSKGIVDNTNIFFSGDKGISVGENSKVTILNSSIISSFIGIESKDNSEITMNNSSIVDNNINLHGYNKNWRYGTDGGSFVIHNSKFLSKINKQILLSKITDASGKKIHKNLENFTTNKNVFITKNNSKIKIENSVIDNDFIYLGNKKNFHISN